MGSFYLDTQNYTLSLNPATKDKMWWREFLLWVTLTPSIYTMPHLSFCWDHQIWCGHVGIRWLLQTLSCIHSLLNIVHLDSYLFASQVFCRFTLHYCWTLSRLLDTAVKSCSYWGTQQYFTDLLHNWLACTCSKDTSLLIALIRLYRLWVDFCY